MSLFTACNNNANSENNSLILVGTDENLNSDNIIDKNLSGVELLKSLQQQATQNISFTANINDNGIIYEYVFYKSGKSFRTEFPANPSQNNTKAIVIYNSDDNISYLYNEDNDSGTKFEGYLDLPPSFLLPIILEYCTNIYSNISTSFEEYNGGEIVKIEVIKGFDNMPSLNIEIPSNIVIWYSYEKSVPLQVDIT